MEAPKLLNELPTLEGSNTKQELALLKNVLRNENEKNDTTVSEKTTAGSCQRTKLQDLWLVLIAMALFLILSNPWTLKILDLFMSNMFFTYIFAVLAFGIILYIIYIFIP